MENEIIFNEDLHFEHKQWRRELAFWEDELTSFKNRLSELITRWTEKKFLIRLEHYQNEFILHGGIIDGLKEDISKHEMNMASFSAQDVTVLNRVFTKKHVDFRERMHTQRRIYNDLKKEFFQFLSEYK